MAHCDIPLSSGGYPDGPSPETMGGVPEWVRFDRTDVSAVVALVQAVAEAGDAGEHGDGVEVVIEVPRKGWFRRLFDDGQPEQARIGVTKPGGEVRYPFHVHLVTDHGGRAARRLPRTPGWAASNSAGEAFWMQKGRAGTEPDWPALVTGALGALAVLRSDARNRGWRAMVDRAVQRT
jgi:hypothetical protein